jgi:hypothetical protein
MTKWCRDIIVIVVVVIPLHGRSGRICRGKQPRQTPSSSSLSSSSSSSGAPRPSSRSPLLTPRPSLRPGGRGNGRGDCRIAGAAALPLCASRGHHAEVKVSACLRFCLYPPLPSKFRWMDRLIDRSLSTPHQCPPRL